VSSIFSTVKGQGNPVILIHGFCETHEIWNEITGELAIDYKVFCPDLPGFGKSPLPEGPFSISDIANMVIEWIEKNKIHKPVVVGHSLGGYVALEIAKQKPNLMGGLGLFHSTAKADSEQKRANRDKVIEFVKKNGPKPFLDAFVPSLFHRHDNPKIALVYSICSTTKKETIINYSLAMRDRPDYLDILANSFISTSFIVGEYDTFVLMEDSISQANSCKNSQLFVLKETSHIGMIESVENSLKWLKAFLLRCF